MAHLFVYNHKNNGLFSQPRPPKRIKTTKEGDIVAILTETLEEAPWLAQVTKVEGRNLSIIWMEGSYTSSWKVATVRQGSKTVDRPLNLQQQPTVRFRNLRYKCHEDARDVSPAPGPAGANASSATAQRGGVA